MLQVQRQRADAPLSVTIGAGKEKWPPADMRGGEADEIDPDKPVLVASASATVRLKGPRGWGLRG